MPRNQRVQISSSNPKSRGLRQSRKKTLESETLQVRKAKYEMATLESKGQILVISDLRRELMVTSNAKKLSVYRKEAVLVVAKSVPQPLVELRSKV